MVMFQSTHPWWMRNQRPNHLWHCLVSIHASVMDAKNTQQQLLLGISFNPRIRDGCEAGMAIPSQIAKFQSTHPWWMRTTHWKRLSCSNVSIHASVMDAKYLQAIFDTACKFQSTHPWWMRMCLHNSVSHQPSFNPRIRDGCEWQCSATAIRTMFQSTHPWWMRILIRDR